MEASAKLSIEQIGSGNMLSDGVQTPELDSKGKPTRKAFRDEAQAWSVWTALENDNRTRTSLNAEIVARHTGKPPHDPAELKAHMQSWRSNFPTLALAGIESRITARLVNTVDNLRSLTNSQLPDGVPDGDVKSKKFQARFTSTVRSWIGWRPFVSSLWTEDVLIGYACVGLLDDYNWRPRLYRSDEGFMPQGSPQHPHLIQMCGLKQSFMIHETIQWIADGKEIADVAGFRWDAVIESVNKASPKNPLWDQPGQGNVSRAYQDLVREANLGMSYSTGAKGVNVAHMLAMEPAPDDKDFQVTHYIIDRDNEHAALFVKECRFKTMDDAICLFTLEPGNSTYYGSKGIGRKTVNICTSIDVCANDRQDARRLAGLRILKGTSAGSIATQLRMTNPFVIITTDAELSTESFQYDAEGYGHAMAELQQILENAVGEYIPNIPSDPGRPGKDARTATAERIDFQREQEQSVAFIARGLGQFFAMMQPIQRRLCDPETDDAVAKEFQQRLKQVDGLADEEIKALADANTAEVVQDLASQKNQQLDAVAAKYINHPMVNQQKLVKRDIEAMSSPQIADDLMLPNAVDPNEEAENWRMQELENARMETGGSINVAPRDNDAVHIGNLDRNLQQAQQGMQQKSLDDPDLPQLMDNLNAALMHYQAHIQNAQKKSGGKSTPQVKQWEQKLQNYEKQLHKLALVLKSYKAKQQGMQQQGQQQQAPGQPGQPSPDQAQGPSNGGMSEKIVTAWIGQYDKLPDPEKRKLEAKGGLGALQPQEKETFAPPQQQPSPASSAGASPTIQPTVATTP